MEPLVLIIAGVGLLAVAGIIALVVFIGRGSRRERAQTTWLAAALAVVALVALVTFNLAMINYTVPTGWIVALVVVGLALLGLIVRLIIDLGWQPLRILALFGVLALTSIAFGALGMSGVGSEFLQPLYASRAAQIAEANGFTALLPAGVDMPTDVLPVDALPEPDAGLNVSYDEFWLQERKAAEGDTWSTLARLVAPGAKPMGADSMPVPEGAIVTSATVQGQPAVTAEYVVTSGDEAAAGKPSDDTKSFATALLVFMLDGTDVRMLSESGERESAGEFVPYEALSAKELIAIAETLEPVE